MSDTANILFAAADLVDRGWTQKAYAVGSDGRSVVPDGPLARKWNVIGAIAAAAGRFHRGAELALTNHLDVWELELWNNEPGRTQAEVSAALRECAFLLRGDGAPASSRFASA